MSVIHNDVRDVTGKQPARGPGMVITRLWMCGHKGGTAGALQKRGIGMLGAACNAAKNLGAKK